MSKRKIEEDDLKMIERKMRRKPNVSNYSIVNIRDRMEDKSLIINPEYQRNFILKESESSKYVESVFLGCCIPEIQIFEEEDNTLEILDGQQRALSLIKFLNNEYPLKGLKELKELNGMYFRDLPDRLCRGFKNYEMSAKVMKFSEDEDDYKYFVFERLNSGSKKLNSQEVRNCVYRGKLINMAKELAKDVKVLNIVKNELVNDERFLITEYVLRVISICESEEMKANASQTINSFLKNQENISDKDVSDLSQKFLRCIKLIDEYIGTEPFEERNERKEHSRIDVESLIINIWKNFNRNEIIFASDTIKEEVASLMKNIEYRGSDYQSNSRECIKNKEKLMKEVIERAIEKSIERTEKTERTDNYEKSNRRFFTKEEKIEIWNNQIYKNQKIECGICHNEIISFDSTDVDHILPFSKGGQTSLDNAQLVHSTCNKIKGSKLDYSII